jgi:uncharacterized protein YndB with AHSA1/START domain
MHSPLEITMSLPVSAAIAFDCFAKKDHLANWWGPAGMEIEIKTFEFKPGGIFHYVLRVGNGFEMWGKFSYLEIEKPGRITLLNSFSNPAGETVPAPEVPFGADWPLEMWTEYRFTDLGDHCELKLTSHPYHASTTSEDLFAKNHDNMKMGFKGTFDKLKAYLEEAGV